MNEEIKKTVQTAGADETTPSHPQYFSWVNSTNEGSNEKQTITNLEYFGWLRKKYGMQLEIYAWDAGNLDGAGGTYETKNSEKLKAQYPHGYGPVVDAAAKIGARMGVWFGPDGFGDTDESAAERQDLIVSLCRDHHFAQFKLDGVCGGLREDKQQYFVDMMKECRKYSPDLVVLNHRLNLYSGMPYATTFLWNGMETYVDVHIGNTFTASHNRAFCFDRGNVPGLQRLSEDHGVCISSSIDYFEDDLIYQAFGRCLILAPEIYGNPWLMRDDEQAHLARIYNLHFSVRDILVNGMLLPDGYGPNAVSRGCGSRRFITTGNRTWTPKTVNIRLDSEIGLDDCGKVLVSVHHPYEKAVGIYGYGDTVSIDIPSFRACLIEVCELSSATPMLTGCEYEVIHDTAGIPDTVKIVKITDKIGAVGNIEVPAVLENAEKFDNTVKSPKFLAHAEKADIPGNSEQLFETARFGMDMDSLEARSLRRSGPTSIPEVQAARDEFFNQKTYMLRGCESRFAFDGNENTFFDGTSRVFFDTYRTDGGCLRVDFGAIYDADEIMIEYYDIDSVGQDNFWYIKKQVPAVRADISSDLSEWRDIYLSHLDIVGSETVELLTHTIHSTVPSPGKRKRAYYSAGKGMRYLRMPSPVDHIYKIALIKDGCEIELKNPRVNNLLPSYRNSSPVCAAQKASVTIGENDWTEGCYIAVALNGEHGTESAYAVAEIDGIPVSFPRRAPDYQSNIWECPMFFTMRATGNYTYYLPVTRDMTGKKIDITVIMNQEGKTDISTDIWLCDGNNEKRGITVSI